MLFVGVAVGVLDAVPVGDTVLVLVRVTDRDGDDVRVDVGEDDEVIEGDAPKVSVVVGVIVEVGDTVTVDVSDNKTPESIKLGSSPKLGPSRMIASRSAETDGTRRADKILGSFSTIKVRSVVKPLPWKTLFCSAMTEFTTVPVRANSSLPTFFATNAVRSIRMVMTLRDGSVIITDDAITLLAGIPRVTATAELIELVCENERPPP